MPRIYRREFLKTAASCLGALGFDRNSWGAQLSGVDAGTSKTTSTGANGIYLNQIGFRPDNPKLATVSANANSFLVRSLKDHSVAFRSTLSAQRLDAASGDTMRLADFSAVKVPGEYRLELDTGATGDSFPIRKDVYDNAFLLAMRSFYGQRCGCSVDLGGGYTHPKCHLDAAFHASSGKTGPCDIHGGWHDAGDYSRFMINASITTGTLLWAWELYGESLHDFAMQIPESGGKVPDFLAEIQWNLRWMLALQDNDGGVWQKQSRDDYCSFIMPQDELGPSYIIGTGSAPFKSTCATADLAAVMAIAARCYSSYAPAFSQQCLRAARAAWTWCQNNPNVFFKNPADIHTAEFADTDCHDELLWAAAELWRTTGDAAFHQAFMGMLPQPLSKIKIDVPSPMQVSSSGYWSYALARRKGSHAAIAAIQQATLKMAGEFVHQGSQNGYGNSLRLEDYAGGSNSIVANHSLALLVADQFEPDSSHLNCVLNNLHYLLGRNCLGISWVTQIGSRSCQHPHHRPSVADNIVAPWPGLLSNGPNANPSDPITKALPQQAPMRMYVDDERAWSSNEPTINCNSPLVFVLAALYAQQRR
jgi:endoglucanase